MKSFKIKSTIKMKQILRYTLLLFIFAFFTKSAIAQSSINPPTAFLLNNGNTVQLKDLKGKVILLDFWYRGCLPCLKATPDLIKLQEEFKNDLVVIGINDIDNKEDISNYYAYKKNTNFLSTYKTSSNISKRLKVNVFPTFIIINQNGEIVKREIGFNKGSIRKTIKKLIQQSK